MSGFSKLANLPVADGGKDMARRFAEYECGVSDSSFEAAMSDIASELQETRARVSGTTYAVRSLWLPLWIIALCSLYYTYQHWSF